MDLYPDAACRACGATHTLSYAAHMRKSHRAMYRYTCPTTNAAVVFRPAQDPEPVILAPADAVPMTWVSD
jgi:hypothetical protein